MAGNEKQLQEKYLEFQLLERQMKQVKGRKKCKKIKDCEKEHKYRSFSLNLPDDKRDTCFKRLIRIYNIDQAFINPLCILFIR